MDNQHQPSDTLTYQELKDALYWMSYRQTLASQIMTHVKEHREPEWKQGDVVQDAEGRVFECSSVVGVWYRPGTPNQFADSLLQRPLKRLVPES